MAADPINNIPDYIKWFNEDKIAVSSLNYDECTARAHEAEAMIYRLQITVKAVREKQTEIIEAETDEKKRQEYLRYKPCPASIKNGIEAKEKKSSEEKKAEKREKEIQHNMQSLSLDREMAIAFLQKMKPNLFT